MLLRMMCKQHGFLAWLGWLFVLGCQHEAAMGSTDTQASIPKAEAAPEVAASRPAAAAPLAAVPVAAPSGNAGCGSDADCHAVDSYCGSCQCLPLVAASGAPKCDGNEVQCFAAPCRGQHAVCKAGSCALAGGSDM